MKVRDEDFLNAAQKRIDAMWDDIMSTAPEELHEKILAAKQGGYPLREIKQ